MSAPILPVLAGRLSSLLARPPRTVWAALAALWAAFIYSLSARPADAAQPRPLLDQLLHNGAHAPIYGVLAALLLLALASKAGPPWRLGARATAVALALAVLYAVSDEWHQSVVPGRAASAIDVATDASGAFAGVALLRWATGGGDRASVAAALAAAAAGAGSALLASL